MGGLWAQYDLNDVATPEGFGRDPARVHDFYNLRRKACCTAQPNDAHLALARLEARLNDDLLIVTQNVDDLHERAGSRQVIHMHGSLLKALCHECGARWPAPELMYADDICATCGKAATRPDVVWFGEIPHEMERIQAAIVDADLFVAIGTSGTVYPAAGFVQLARAAGADTLDLNLESSETASRFDKVITGKASETVPDFVAQLLTA